MKTSTIINCFRKAKFIRAVDDALLIPTPNDNEIEIEDILDTLPYFEDNSLPICDMNADEGTVLDTLIENEDEDGDDEEEVKIIKETEVLKHFSELSRFLLNNGCDPNIIFEFKSIIFDCIDASKKQTKITDFYTLFKISSEISKYSH